MLQTCRVHTRDGEAAHGTLQTAKCRPAVLFSRPWRGPAWPAQPPALGAVGHRTEHQWQVPAVAGAASW